MSETTTSDAVLAQLESLTARLMAVETLEARIAGLEADNLLLKADNHRLTAGLAAPAVAAPPPIPPTTSRRGMLRRVMSASAAAALLLVAREATTADASSRTSVIGPSQANYGIAATFGTGGVGSLDDPNRLI